MARSMPGSPPTRPPTYVVGTQHAQRPLVSPEHVKGHIRLLRAFYNLRITVEDCKDRRIPEYAAKMDKDTRWRWFVHLAVERFERWVKSLESVPLEKFVTGHIPPVDVWMVWHAYLLSPCWYAEDCERLAMLQQLRLLNMIVVGSINIGKVVQLKPSNTRMEAWQKQTGTPFNPFEATTAAESRLKELECPRCRTMVYVPFANDNGTGFAEEKFSVTCPLPGCMLRITHDNLAVAKFVRDLAEGDETREHFVAGSLFCPSGKRDARHAKVIRDQLLRSAYFSGLGPLTDNERLVRLDRVREVKESIGYSLERLREAIMTSLRNCPAASVTRVLSAYTDGSPFSINLVDAVLRQCHFTQRMDELGWLKSGTFRQPDKRVILEHSVMRYHAFLDLMTAYPSPMLVPTLDIDLVWHTHQLMASRYSVDCHMYVGRLVDHDLSVTESRFSSTLEETCRAWQMRFQVSYLQCGCTVPDATSVHKFIRLVRSYLSCRSQLQLILHPEHLPATHPSTHNAPIPSKTVCTGTTCKMNHNGKRKEGQSQSPTPHPERADKRSQRMMQFNSDWRLTMHSPATPMYFERELPALPKSFS
ncbi:hypothetical protein JVT61DRAFT_14192 [Boletus reticuloceps]|uniref:Uncharacterized protein n=1 Tax=Boletus reticuloceps TaxID=495285 RepID=A0A8I3A2H1_9AGAM|nr:hypothetical protein JVT61DRAFT_14192 [Boletus reticuloceps]